MKVKAYLLPIYLFLLASIGFSQAKEAVKINEFNERITCGIFSAYLDSVLYEYENSAGSKIYIVYYEGKHEILTETKSGLQRRWFNPRVGDALNLAKDSSLYLRKMRSVSAGDILIVDGGFKEKSTIEHWIVPKGTEQPKLTPTLERKNIKFRKGKPFSNRGHTDFCYSG